MSFKYCKNDINFPYSFKKPTIKYIEALLKRIDEKGHICIESETGTGKTLSYLCALLTKLDTKKNKIIICSRTYNQLLNILEDFRKTTFKESKSIIILSGK